MDEAALPPPFTLLQQTIDAATKNPAGFLLAGLGALLVIFPLAFASVFGLYFAMFLGMVPGMLIEDELVLMLGMFGAMFFGLFGMIALIAVVSAPLNASVMRAVDAHQRTGAPLSFASSFDTARVDLVRVVGAYALVMGAALGGMMMCYVPGLIAGFFLSLTVPGVVVDGLSPVESAKRSVAAVQKHLGWHLQVYLIAMVVFMVLSQIPILGGAIGLSLGYDFQLRAYRAAFPAS